MGLGRGQNTLTSNSDESEKNRKSCKRVLVHASSTAQDTRHWSSASDLRSLSINNYNEITVVICSAPPCRPVSSRSAVLEALMRDKGVLDTETNE